MTKPRTQRKPISVLDLGFEDATRLKGLASRYPRKQFMGIEWEKRKGLVTRRHNLKLVYGDVLSKLRRLPANSVKIVTADFLFSGFKMRGFHVDEETRIGRVFAGRFRKGRIKVAKQVYRVLVPNGRFFVTEWKINSGVIKELLEEAGFNVKERPVPESEIGKDGKTLFLKGLPEFFEKHPEAIETDTPMRLIATKPREKAY
ncbi:MAG: hypothetical protein JW744_05860 [Candidatus Diapherotrites archaeon]|uniref:Uncharacterized protein n=1 Tax=Candidatus Iainarchaeum sp. TaxID=3101447 RepID=A0A939C595_9ARCH|nr:hypothetical protein [Candidatus Diapherotrites archaeon]